MAKLLPVNMKTRIHEEDLAGNKAYGGFGGFEHQERIRKGG